MATQPGFRIFCVAEARGGFAHGDDRRGDCGNDLRIEFRRKSGARIRLRCAVVQYLARVTRGEPCLFRAVALAVAQTSSCLPHHASRHHHTADRLAHRQNLGNRRNNHGLQRRPANEPAPCRSTPASRARCRWNHERLSRGIFTSSAKSEASARPRTPRQRRALTNCRLRASD